MARLCPQRGLGLTEASAGGAGGWDASLPGISCTGECSQTLWGHRCGVALAVSTTGLWFAALAAQGSAQCSHPGALYWC